MTPGWALLALELHRWRRAGRRPQLWWRDDDACTTTPALERLIACAEKAGAPLAVAVIPERADAGLAARLNALPAISVLQHGTDHDNGGPAEHPTQFDAVISPEAVTGRLAEAWTRLQAFERRLPIYVPPWNDLPADLDAAVAGAGFAAVSAWAGPRAPGRLDAHLDVLRWRAGARFAGTGRVLRRLRHALARRRRSGCWDEPIGLLTHHLDHDPPTWRFLERLIAFGPLKMTAQWRGAGELLGLDSARTS